MKLAGAREGYDPKKLDDRRKADKHESMWPFDFKPFRTPTVIVRTAAQKAFKKRPLHKRRKHGRTTATKG